MLPADATGLPSLADVMPGGLQALRGRENPLGFPALKKFVVFVIDGLGVDTLIERSGHARTLSSVLDRSSIAMAGFPTTTVSGLSTITTGTLAGTHGMIGYSSFDVANDRVVRPLSGWDDLMDPSEWQLASTVFERAAEFGIPSHAIGIERFR
ncbi:MAG: alkaline phosphatase family protein, partial [Cryobacterium sp.]|nr:alkaline phosphatase family protein [Cryobacterium sp.]